MELELIKKTRSQIYTALFELHKEQKRFGKHYREDEKKSLAGWRDACNYLIETIEDGHRAKSKG